MVEKVIICFCLLAVFLMRRRNQKLKSDIYTFGMQLEQCLDLLISGENIESFSGIDDSLWNKIYEKLRKLHRIWKQQNQKSKKEKEQVKELISDISHQTKTPIANIKMYLEILEQERSKDLFEKEFLKKLKGQAEKLDFLMQSMVEMSRLETGIIEVHQEENFLYETLGQAVAAIVPAAEKKKIHLYVECEEQMKVLHDKKWTEEAIFNVLDNAVKYTDYGGKIKIKVIRQEFFTQISICDTGKGIAPERQAQIFSRFYREPEVHNQEGVGVGLYLTRKILTLQKGYIEVRSEKGKGADFRIYLPNKLWDK